MEYITHYFIRHADVYQENYAGNIDIHARAANLPITVKAVVNGIIVAGVRNIPDNA